MARYAWLDRIRRQQPTCIACGGLDWAPTYIEPERYLIAAGTPFGHPELEGGMDAKAVLPVTCKHCGYVATYSVQHLQDAAP